MAKSRFRKLTSENLEATSGGALDFSDPTATPRVDFNRERRDLDQSYWGFADSVRSGREAMDALEQNEQMRPNVTPDQQRQIDDAAPVWQQQLDTARDEIQQSNERMEENGREPWSEDMVPTPDEGEEQYENLGTEDEPIYGA